MIIAKNILEAKLAQKPKNACNFCHCQESYIQNSESIAFFVIVKTIPLRFRYVNTG